MVHKLIRTFYYILFFATPLVMFSKTTEIFEFNKLIFIYCMTVLIAGAWAVKTIAEGRKRFKLQPFQWILLAFLATQILSTIFSIDIHTSIFGYYGRFNGGLLSTIAYIVLFFILLSELNYDFLLKLLKVGLVSSLIVILWGLPGKFNFDLTCGVFTGTFNNSCWTNQFQPDQRMFSTLGQPNWLGAYLDIYFFIGLFFLLRNWIVDKVVQNKSRFFYILYLLLNFSTVIFTGSRSALLALAVGFILFPIGLWFWKEKDQSKQLIKQWLILAFLLLAPILIFKTGIEKIDRFLPFHTAAKTASPVPVSTTPQSAIVITDSFDIRKIVWQGAWQLALRYPLFGSGVETFAYSYYFTRPSAHNATSEWDYLYNKAHNEFINYLATTGFIGFAAYMLLIAAVFFAFAKRYFMNVSLPEIQGNKKQEYRLILLSVVISYITILITNFVGFSVTSISLFFFLVPAFFLASFNEKDTSVKLHFERASQKVALCAVIATVIFGIYYFTAYWYADTQYESAQNDIHDGYYSQGAYKLLNILKYHYEHVYEDKLSVALIGTALTTDNKSDMQKLLLMSDYYNESSIKASPFNMLYWKTRATILSNSYQITNDSSYLQKAIDAMETAKKIAPTDPRNPYEESLYYVMLFDATKKQSALTAAYNQVQTALSMKSDYPDALLEKATILVKMNKKNEAKAVYEYVLKKFDPNNADIKAQLQNLDK